MHFEEPINFILPFRGSRNYLHSTDIFPALTRLGQEIFSATAFVESLTLRRPASHQMQAHFVRSEGAFGTFRIREKSGYISGSLVETDKPVFARVAFDESKVAEAAILSPGVATLEEPVSGRTPFEEALLLAKILAVRRAPQHWWFCQSQFRCPLSNTYPLQVEIHSGVGNRFLSFNLSQGSRIIGSMRVAVGSSDGARNSRARSAA